MGTSYSDENLEKCSYFLPSLIGSQLLEQMMSFSEVKTMSWALNTYMMIRDMMLSKSQQNVSVPDIIRLIILEGKLHSSVNVKKSTGKSNKYCNTVTGILMTWEDQEMNGLGK